MPPPTVKAKTTATATPAASASSAPSASPSLAPSTEPSAVPSAVASAEPSADDGLSAVFAIDEAGQKALKPGDGSLNGDYAVSSASKITLSENAKTSYEESLVGNTIKGFVYTSVSGVEVPLAGVDIYTTEYDASQKKSIEVKKATTGDDGYYYFHSVSGVIQVTAKKLGYTDSVNKDVKVNRNNPTACNFFLNDFAEKEIFFVATIVDKDDPSKAVEGATVTLLDAEGKEAKCGDSVVKAVTDANGKIGFGNSASTLTNATAYNADTNPYGDTSDGTEPDEVVAAANMFRSGEEAKNFLKFNTDYQIKVEKDISSTNFTSVYAAKDNTFTGVRMSSSAKKTEDTYNAVLVPETKSIAYTPAWTTEEVTAFAAVTATSQPGDGKFMEISAKLVGTDGKTSLVDTKDIVARSLYADRTTANVAKKAIDFSTDTTLNFFGGDTTIGTANNLYPRIPDGTYFLILKDGYGDGDDITTPNVPASAITQVGATSVATVTVKDGVATVASTAFKVAATGDMTSTINNVYKSQNLPHALIDTVTPNIPADTAYVDASGTEQASAVDAAALTAGVQIPTINADDTRNYTQIAAAGDNTVGVKYEIYQTVSGVDVLLGEADESKFVYTLTTNNAGKPERKINCATTFQNLEVGGAYKVKAASKAYLDGTGETALKVVDATGYANNAVNYDGAGNIAGIAFGANLTVTSWFGASVNLVDEKGNDSYIDWFNGDNNTKLIDVSSNAAFKGLTAGKKYKVKVNLNIDGVLYNEVESDWLTIEDFKDHNIEITKKLEEKPVTGLTGYVRDEKKAGINSAKVAMLQKDDKGAWKVKYSATADASGKYGINTPDKGTYTVVVRCANYETVVTEVEIKDSTKSTQDFTMVDGGKGELDLLIQDQNGLAPTAIDSTGANWTFNVTDEWYDETAPNAGGIWTLTKQTNEYEYKTPQALSVGTYTVAIANAKIATYTGTYTVVNRNQTVKDGSVRIESKTGKNTVTLGVQVNTSTAANDGNVGVALVYDSKGTLVDQQYGTIANNTLSTIDCTVGANGTYTVEVYQSGYFVGSATKTIQAFDDVVTVGLSPQTRD